jgi:hypothetical protein
MNRMHRSITAVTSSLAVLLLLSPAALLGQPKAAAANDAATGAVPALWKTYDLYFHYFGFNTYYTCSGLEDRLEQILKQLGADKDVRATATGCLGFNEVNNMLSARIKARLPVAPKAEAEQSFLAVSKPVTLQTRLRGDPGLGDCELLEQVRRQLLPALSIPLVKDGLHCSPGQIEIGSQSLQVMTLVAQP